MAGRSHKAEQKIAQYRLDEPEDYNFRPRTWKMKGEEVETHEFWVKDYEGRFSPGGSNVSVKELRPE